MKTFNSKLVKRDKSIYQSAEELTTDEVLAGIRRLLEREDFSNMYLFRRYPLAADNETINTHLYIELN